MVEVVLGLVYHLERKRQIHGLQAADGGTIGAKSVTCVGGAVTPPELTLKAGRVVSCTH
jgi:hypothetical protein